MMDLYDSEAERALAMFVAGRGEDMRIDDERFRVRLVKVAREHGVEGVLPKEHGDVARELALRMQHDVRVAEVMAIGRAFASASIPVMLLKGIGLAERLYDPPWMRGSTDIDILVVPERLDEAVATVAALGYELESGARARFFRERHFHLHARSRRGGTPLELHFMAYRGFGSALTAQDLFAESEPLDGFPGVRVPSAPRELVYLAVHAAAHRFVRMAWLLDIVLLLRGAKPSLLPEARAFARARNYSAAFEAALTLLRRRFHVPIPEREPSRVKVALALAPEPRSPWLSSATRFLYTSLLCDGIKQGASYAGRATYDKLAFPSD